MQLQKTISELKCGDKFVFKNEVGVWQKIDYTRAKCIFPLADEITYCPSTTVFVVSESEKCKVPSDSTSDSEIEISSIIDTQIDKIKQDLILRKSVISSVTVLEPNTGNQTVLGYKPNGVLYLISSEYPIIQFYGADFGKGGMYSIGNIYSDRAASNYRKLKQLETAKKDEIKADQKNKIGLFKRIYRKYIIK